MLPVERLYLDTNIFILLAEGEHGPELNLLQNLVRMVARKDADRPFLCTSEFALAELLVHPLRNTDAALRQVYQNWFVPGSPWLEIGPADREVLVHAAWIRALLPSVKMPDAIHLSTAVGFKCTHFLTRDMKLPDTVSIRDPLTNAPIVASELSIIQPTVETLAGIVDSLS
ncbi:type II toxin-antitoxin system VapC family toxin [Breoghania sp. JC706]|uniref:type II toxin-antitoxin system VapC family toxin n=1 Tax=Breoghania sp. JC706 TaxID=3117732 RepID=UPI00300BD3E5